MAKVLNKYKDGATPDSVYIGRGSVWGNPYIIGEHGTRDEVIALYEIHLENMLTKRYYRYKLLELYGKDLVCFCKPQRCHGDIILDRVNRLKEEMNNEY